MINITRAVTCLEGLVGFRSSANTCLDQLSGSLTGSSSSLNVMDEPGITQEVLEAAKSDDYPTLSDYLTYARKSAVQEVIQLFINQHKELTKNRTLLDNVDIVKSSPEYGLSFADTVTKAGRFVGFEITPKKDDNIAVLFKHIGVQFSQANPGLKIYLYESSQKEPIKDFTLTGHTKVDSLQWFDLSEWVANYKWTGGATGATYYLGYFESDLVGNAINTLLWLNCCGNDWVGDYQEYSMIRGVEFPATALSGTNLPNLNLAGYGQQSFGLHLKMAVTCDITDTICDNGTIFAYLVRGRIARNLFWTILNSDRLNRKVTIGREQALVNIERVEKEFDANLKSIKLDFTEIGRECMGISKKVINVGTLR